MQEIDDGDVELGEFLDGRDHLWNSQISAEEDASMRASLSLEPDIYVKLAEFLAESVGNTE